jgi:hypothetical protein
MIRLKAFTETLEKTILSMVGSLMFFKWINLFFIVPAVITLILGCANNYDFEEEELDIRLNFNTGCIDQIERFFENYMKERSSVKEIKSNINCMIEAVDYVKIRVAGEEGDRYSLSEIKSFFNQFVFKDNPKDEDFYSNILVLKREILGGSDRFITFKELQTIQRIINSLEFALINLRPLVQEMLGSESFSNKNDIEKVVFYGFGFLNELLSYDIKSFSILSVLKTLGDLIELDDEVEEWIEVFNLLRGKARRDFTIEKTERLLVLNTFSSYYSSFFKLSVELNSDWEENRESFSRLETDVLEFINLLELSIEQNQRKAWVKQDLDHIFNVLGRTFAEDISEQTISNLVDVVFYKWFTSSEKEVSLTKSGIKKIKQDVELLSDFLDQSKSIENFVGPAFPTVDTATSIFNEFLNLAWPSLITNERSFLVDVVPFDSRFNFKALFQWSWAFTAAEIFTRAYARDSRGLSIDQVKEAYLDVFGLLVDLDILTEASRSSWFRIFNEGDLLVPSANPNGYVSRQEMSEYFSYMFSAYFSGNEAFDRAKIFCPNLSKACIFEKMQTLEGRFFRTMPSLNHYLSSNTSSESFELWANSFEYIAKLDNNSDDYTSNMFFRASVGNQYVEVLFRKYDLDQTGTFNFEETEKAFEDFKYALRLLPQVKGTIAESNDLILKAFFTYFVDKGRLPELNNGYPSGSFIKYMFLCGIFNASSCSFESDRSSILAILAYLTSVELVDE